MNMISGFFVGLNKKFDERADSRVADHCNSIFRLIGIEIWAMLISFAGLSCLVVCLIYIWLPLSYPWYAIPGAIVSPIVMWRSVHVIRHANYYLAQF